MSFNIIINQLNFLLVTSNRIQLEQMKAEIRTLLEGAWRTSVSRRQWPLNQLGPVTEKPENSDESLSSVFPSMPFLFFDSPCKLCFCVCLYPLWKMTTSFWDSLTSALLHKGKINFLKSKFKFMGRKCIRPASCTPHDQLDVDWATFLSGGSFPCSWIGQVASSQLYMHQSPCNDCVHRRAGEFLEKSMCWETYLNQERWGT